MGSYIKIKKLPKTKKQEAITSYDCKCNSTRTVSRNDSNVKFCAKCGKPTKTTVKSYEEDINICNLINPDRLYNTEGMFDVLLPNKNMKNGRTIDVSESFDGEIPLIDPVLAKQEFVDLYSKELQMLDEAGVEYEIKTGLVVYVV